MGSSRSWNWKVFFLLLAATVLSILAVVPYVLTLQSNILKHVTLPMPLWKILALQMVENTLIFAVMIAAGLYLAGKVGLGLPFLESALGGEGLRRDAVRILGLAAAAGVLTSLLVAGLDLIFVRAGVSFEAAGAAATPPPWQGFLASFYGGIAEEVSMRLFLMSLLVWLMRELKRALKLPPSGLEMWLGILISAVIFGLGHLPMTSALITLTPLVIARALVLNGIYGVVMGWLYWKHGLESAMVAHFSGDLVLHVVIPAIVAL